MSLVYRRYVFCRRLTPPYSRSADIRSGNRPGKLADTTARKTKFQGKKKATAFTGDRFKSSIGISLSLR